MKILVTGANGLLGQHLIKRLIEITDHEIIATGRGECRLPFQASGKYNYFSLDINDGMAVNQFMQLHQPTVIVHAAAITQPDACEQNPVGCWDTNVTATRFLLDASEAVKAFFIYISTDFVFDGLNGPYKETDATGPVNYYQPCLYCM